MASWWPQEVFAADNTTRRYDVEVPIERSSWVALRVRGPAHPAAFDGLAWAHTSPVYVKVGGREIASPQDAAYFVDWIEQMIKSVGARDRFAQAEDRRQVEALFRGAQKKFRRMADAD